MTDKLYKAMSAVPDDEREIIFQIAHRAYDRLRNYPEFYARYDEMDIALDVKACHAIACPLRLQELLDADDFNFFHDVCGINAHISRRTGKLLHCFRPRFAKPAA